MKAKTTDIGIINNDFADILFTRYSMRSLDPNYQVPREEILQMIQSATTAPSALDTQPWLFLIADTPEGKSKLDNIMHLPIDRGRVAASSFAVVVLADKDWINDFEDILNANAEVSPSFFTPELVSFMSSRSVEWYEELVEADELMSSISFQCGLVAMQFMLVARAHGYECGAMDDWDKWDIAEVFGIDLERYVPMICIAVGKPTGETEATTRRSPESAVVFV